jgi:hypothetical protein
MRPASSAADRHANRKPPPSRILASPCPKLLGCLMPEENPIPKAPLYLSSLKKCDTASITIEGRVVSIWELAVVSDASALTDWAARFRQHYCLDSEIDRLRGGTGYSRSEYLLRLVFPDKTEAPGPSVRAGDFAEILVADYLEYISGYWVPRCKYQEKAVRNESVKGVDILGFLMPSSDPSRADTLIAFEVKAQLTGTSYNGKLQDAVNDSSKDLLRRALSLNATKRRLLDSGNTESARIVQRFQNPSDHPYVYRSGAAVVLSSTCFDKTEIENSTNISMHNNKDNLELLIIQGTSLLDLVHAMYERAANEA